MEITVTYSKSNNHVTVDENGKKISIPCTQGTFSNTKTKVMNADDFDYAIDKLNELIEILKKAKEAT